MQIDVLYSKINSNGKDRYSVIDGSKISVSRNLFRMEESMDTNILLESGTNELEILEFMVSGNYYGINGGGFYYKRRDNFSY